jgi:NADH-quinone oxidoreductase subunit H
MMMYMVAEFLHMITAAFLIVILFLGGWHFWGLTGSERMGTGSEPSAVASAASASGEVPVPILSGGDVTWPVALLRVIVLLGKVMAVILFFMLARWSWPRFRFDQLMEIGWKVMIPWGLVNIVAVAAWIEYGGHLAGAWGLSPTVSRALTGGCVLVLCWLVTVLADPTSSENRPRRARSALP